MMTIVFVTLQITIFTTTIVFVTLQIAISNSKTFIFGPLSQPGVTTLKNFNVSELHL
jgi:hypothetical protein